MSKRQSAYHLGDTIVNNLASRRIGMYVDVVQLTHPPGVHWFGYYDKRQFDSAGTRALVMRVRFEGRSPGPEDAVEIGVIDLTDNNRWTPIGTSTAWNWQQGCMLQWIPGSDSQVIWNDRGQSGFISRIRDLGSGEELELQAPISAIHPDGTRAIYLDFARMHYLEPGYGYVGFDDPARSVAAPANSGLWEVDLATGGTRLLITVEQAVTLYGPHESSSATKHWLTQPLYSPDGARFAFMHAWHEEADGIWDSRRLLTANSDGEEIALLDRSGLASHYIWRDPEHILSWGAAFGGSPGFYLWDDRSGAVEQIGHGILLENGHCTYLPDLRFILSDTYPDVDRKQSVYVYDTVSGKRIDIASFIIPAEYDGEFRCDCHPRTMPNGRSIVVDSAHAGGRQMYRVDIGGIIDS